MAQFFSPSQQIVSPELLAPGRKPTGLVELRKGHPLVRGLRVALLEKRDIITGWESIANIVGASHNGTYRHLDKYNSVVLELGEDFSEYTFFARVNAHGFISGGYHVGIRLRSQDNTLACMLQNLGSVPLRIINYSTTTNTSGTSTYVNDPTAFGARSNGTDISTMGRNGLWSTSTAVIPTPVENFLIGVNADTEMAYECLFFWDRYLSDQEFAAFKNNPYQILKPYGPDYLPFDVGGDTKPALLMSAGQIKQYTDESPNRPLCINADGSVEGYLVVSGKKPLVVDTGDMRALGVGETLDR